MWISVVFLGVFQTLLLVPLRIIRLIKKNNIKEFQEQITLVDSNKSRINLIKSNVGQGNVTFLFYLVDFVIQLVSFITIGRLFLTDFYNLHLDPKVLYDFVPYPAYPIHDTFFKIPYPEVVRTMDFGWKGVFIAWGILIAIQILVLILRKIYRSSKKNGKAPEIGVGKRLKKYTSGYLVIGMILIYILVRNFPVELAIQIFYGDVSIPNRQLNTITAISTSILILWFGIPENIRKANLAREAGIPDDVIGRTQRRMFKDTLKNAALLGLGAFLITNQIPSAFELSVFTLEVISLASPLTLDRLILGRLPRS